MIDAAGTRDPSNDTPTRGAVISAVVLATLIGALVRGVHVLLADFPLNDGALFLTMTRDLVDNGFALPVTTSYNGSDIPFAYPPLGFYLAGLVSLTGLDLFTIFRLVPLMLSIAAIPVVYLFAAEVLPMRFAAVLATVAYALTPRAFEWLIAGGGVTRALGVIFALLVLCAALRLERDPTPRRVIVLGILAALAALSHPEAVIVAGLWLIVILVTGTARRRTFIGFVGAAAIATVLLLPWLVVVVLAHGLAAILGAGSSGFDIGDGLVLLAMFDITNEPWLTLIGALALVGILIRAAERDWRLLLWSAVLIIDPRGGSTYITPILAVAAAVALTEAVLPALRWRPPAPTQLWPDRRIGTGPYLALGVMVMLMAAGSIGARTNDLTPLFGLSSDTRAAITKVGELTAPSDKTVVASGTGWWVDATAEWFPVLAERRSASTVQGAEWLGADGWAQALSEHATLQACVFDSVDCFETWLDANATDASYVFFPRGAPSGSPLETECCPALRAPLIAAGYEVVFDDAGGTLLALP